MSENAESDKLLVERIRSGEPKAWEDLIGRYEGRLLAFAESRIGNRATAEDIVQEAFVGFLNSLPNYDGERPLEGYLFSICAYKLTDQLRRDGRRPAVPLSHSGSSDGEWQISGRNKGASSIARSSEKRELEEAAVKDAVHEQIARWKERGDWIKLLCIELVFVAGMANKEVAQLLSITEQQVANFKFDFLARTRSLVARQSLDLEVFPELADAGSGN